MKIPTLRTRKLFRQACSVLLCCLLTLGCLALPASSAEPDAPLPDDGVSAPADPGESEPTEPGEGGEESGPPAGYREVSVYFHVDEDNTIVEVLNSADRPSFEMPAIPQKDGYRFTGWYTDETEDGELLEQIDGEIYLSGIAETVTEMHLYAHWEAADPDPTASPEPETATLTFRFGQYGTATVEAAVGEYPEIPAFPEKDAWRGYGVLYWTDAKGKRVDPAGTPVTGDAVYTGKLGKTIQALLDTDNHKSYMNGKDGLLRPTEPITRAEVATILSNLLRTKDFPHTARFKDVKSGDWYADAIGLISTLGIAGGYKDGTFRPTQNITRAEFVKMAASCGQLISGSNPFKDVPNSSWARPYIASAYAQGWISLNSAGTFRPNDNISREEVIKIVNLMLGRTGDATAKNKENVRNFADVFPDRWSYPFIIEATTNHTYHVSEAGKETWETYTRYEPAAKPGWLKVGDRTYYIGQDGKCLRGAQTINGEKYIFDQTTGASTSGFMMVNGWKRYYKNGQLMDDISNLGVVSGPYYIKVYKPANYLIVFAKGSDGKYNIPVRAMLTSCGNPTPTGEFYTPNKYRWLQMVGGSWAQWCTQIMDSYLFHSVPNTLHTNTSLWVNEYNNLGTTRSLGCIRLNCEDAKWIYDNCGLGTHVTISPTETSGPLKRPAGLKLPAGHSWDPTDPTAYYLCQQRGCH